MRRLPEIVPMSVEALEQLYENSTCATWYAHGPGDQAKLNEATVRGPYFRWFVVSSGDEDYQKNVAHVYDDAKYAAAAMNNIPHLIAKIKELEEKLKVL